MKLVGRSTKAAVNRTLDCMRNMVAHEGAKNINIMETRTAMWLNGICGIRLPSAATTLAVTTRAPRDVDLTVAAGNDAPIAEAPAVAYATDGTNTMILTAPSGQHRGVKLLLSHFTVTGVRYHQQ
jgi:hypothetical protein